MSRPNPSTRRIFSLFSLAILLTVTPALAQNNGEPKEEPKPASVQALRRGKNPSVTPQPSVENVDQERNQRLADYLTGAKFVGRFTIIGKEDGDLPKEEYTIAKCEKLPEGNLFRFTARIRYGDTDAELPMDLPVEWAGDTPVISLSNMWLPGLGTFSSRVVIHQGSYAGTWSHDDKGGHLFGVIVKEAADKAADGETPVESPSESKSEPVPKAPSSATTGE